MGLLAVGTPLPWKEAKKYGEHVRVHGIEQFIHIYNRNKNRKGNTLLWGDEIEYMVVDCDDENQNARLSLRQAEILKELEEEETKSDSMDDVSFHPEYGRYMLEATPAKPYTGSLSDICTVEANMRKRRIIANKHMLENEVPLTITSFPRLGADFAGSDCFTNPYYPPTGEASRSFFLPDEIINPHIRFPTLTANIRERRGSKVAMNIPLFKDKYTPPFPISSTNSSPGNWIDGTIPYTRNLYPEDKDALPIKDGGKGAALPNHIYMDSMGFGMGCCCLQITFQATDIDEARTLYDQLTPLGPIMLALSAASPAWRGFLSDQDCRWNVIAGSVDDRTEEERGLKPLKESKYVIPKSRYDSVDYYISRSRLLRPDYNDIPLVLNTQYRDRLLSAGVDPLLANHISHLFIRDPLVIFKETLDQDDEKESLHFENIQSTNWQTIRFKPPPPESEDSIGWRVEFRSMEVQITDLENAAFSIFIVLVTRAILSFGLNFYIPISKVDENMKVAHHRDAVLSEKFWFRKNIMSLDGVLSSPRPGSPNEHYCSDYSDESYLARAASFSNVTTQRSINNRSNNINNINNIKNNASSSSTSVSSSTSSSPTSFPSTPSTSSSSSSILPPVEEEYAHMSINTIINGCTDVNNEDGIEFPGLIPIIRKYLDKMNVEIEQRCLLEEYLKLISLRASGKLDTAATWMRKFIRSHPSYKNDSVVNKKINYDLIRLVEKITLGKGWEDEKVGKSLLGGFKFRDRFDEKEEKA